MLIVTYFAHLDTDQLKNNISIEVEMFDLEQDEEKIASLRRCDHNS